MVRESPQHFAKQMRFAPTAGPFQLSLGLMQHQTPAAAALHLDVTFWVLMHAVWVTQLVQFGSWKRIDWAVVKWPLIAFAVLGNLSLFLWEEQLLAVFPS
jgi:hypothetical protein